MRLARHDDPHRPAGAVQQRAQPLGVAEQQVRALVRREAPREAEVERVLVEALEHRAERLRAVAAGLEPVGQHLADLVEHRALVGAVRPPQLQRRHRARGAEVRRPRALVAAPHQRGHRFAGPGREVHTVGHRRDRHLAFEQARPERVQQLLRGAAVHLADAVDVAREAHREVGHVEDAAAVFAVLAPQREEAVPRQADPLLGVAEVGPDQVLAEAVVTRRHRRVRREQRGLRDVGPRRLEGQPLAAHEQRRALERQERRVPLVHVVARRTQVHGAQQAHAAAAQHDLLLDPHLALAAVEVARDRAVLFAVLRHVGVEQVERHAADARAPRAQHDLATRHRHAHLERAAVGPADEVDRQLGRAVLPVDGDLLAVARELLLHVAEAIEQPDADQRHVQVARGLEVVAREDAEAARVDRQRVVHAELRREVGDRVLAVERRRRRVVAHGHRLVGARHVGVEALTDLLQPLEVVGVGHLLFERLEADALQERDRVLTARGEARRELLEQLAHARRPRPPEVARQPLEPAQLLRQRRRGLEGREARGRAAAARLQRAARQPELHDARLAARLHRVERLVVGLQVVGVEVLPRRAPRRLAAPRAQRLAALGLVQERLDRLGGRGDHLLVGDALARDHDDPVLGAEPRGVGPPAEAGEVGGDRGHADRERFLRRVAPRLVVGRVDAEVGGGEHGLVLAPQQVVVRAQVGRDLHDLDAAAGRVVEAQPRAVRVHRVVLLVEEVVRAQAQRAVRCGGALEALGQLPAHAGVAGGHQQERDHPASLALLDVGQRVEQQLDALVVELVAARQREERRVGDVFAELRGCDRREVGARRGAVALGELRHHRHVDAVGQQRRDLSLVQQLGLGGGDLADRREDVRRARAGALDRVLGLHAVVFGELRRRLAAETVVHGRGIGRDPERRQGAAEHRGVRGEDRADARDPLLQVEQCCAGHPLVRLHDGPAVERRQVLLPPELDDLRRRRREQHRLDVVPVARDRVDLVALPEAGEDAVLLFVEPREPDQDAARPARDAPAADADRHADPAALADELVVARLVVERRLRAGPARELRADRDVVVAEALHRGHGLGRQHRVDAPDLVAHLPADLEQLVALGHLTSSSWAGAPGVARAPGRRAAAGRRPRSWPSRTPRAASRTG